MQVLSIGETVEEVSDSGFLGPVPTLQVQLLTDDSLLQVCSLTVLILPSCKSALDSNCYSCIHDSNSLVMHAYAVQPLQVAQNCTGTHCFCQLWLFVVKRNELL